MPLDTRRCFWFGTEERAGFISTPLKGADSSPSAWGVDGTLLNGGGYAFNSFGSHKRYSYEWPQSSSPEAAQLMKSYRDGTYGRGLLYFLEPGIYRTNILPAHWADPSMSINNEAPSLVYGVDPIAVPTSGGFELGLPITSAQYDLSSVPVQTTPTPESSVFIPVPTGHTLFLGAFYSASGSGGIFATPINGNGTLGTTLRLTEKGNSETDVVNDQISGDIRGVRLWVGRESAIDSTVTIAAMSGRLIETSDLPVYGPWEENARNRLVNPVISGSSTVGWSGTAVGGVVVVSNEVGITPPTAVPTATREVRGTWTTAPTSGFPGLTSPKIAVTVGETIPLRLFARRSTSGVLRHVVTYYNSTGTGIGSVVHATSGTLSAGAWWEYSGSVTIPASPAGIASITIDIRFASGEFPASGTWIGVTSGTTAVGGMIFDGSSITETDTERGSWLGAENESISIYETRTKTGTSTKQEKLMSGPWIGGQGHSGCRFAGTPSYVNNGPVEGGRVGYAATFVEVGSWVYG